MKFLYYGDRHNRITTPENRIDDFQKSMNTKDDEIIKFAKENDIYAYLQPGDFWDSPNPPLDYASDIIKKWFNVDVFSLLKNFTNNMNKQEILNEMKNFVPMIGVAGNHELYGNNINTLPKTMIGFMEKLGLMKFATKNNPFIINTEDGLTIAITGTHYHLDIDTDQYLSDYIVEKKLGDFHIHIVHGMLSDKSMGKLIKHTTIDQIINTKADLTISGHDHIGFPLTNINGKYFVNTGAIPRLSNNVKEIGRNPKFLLIDITKKDGMKLKEIYLKSAKKGDIILDRSALNEKKDRTDKLEELKRIVREAEISKKTDISEIINEISVNKKLDTEIKNDVINKVSEKKKNMDKIEQCDFADTYIDKIILENFQSHQYTEIDVSRGFNVFVGESRQGKSAMLRAIDWVYENKPLGKSFIREGSEYCKVTLCISNGYVISRYVEAKKSGKNGYYITDPNNGETEFFNTKILPEVQRILGFKLFNIDEKDLQFNLNFLKQGKGWFMIGDDYSSPVKAKIIGAIYGTQYADAVIRDLETEERRMLDKSKIIIEDHNKIENAITQYDYLGTLKTSIDSSEKLIKEIEFLRKRKSEIQLVLEKRNKLITDLKEICCELDYFKKTKEARNLEDNAKKNFAKQQKIVEIFEIRENYFKMLSGAIFIIDLLKNTDKLKLMSLETASLNSRKELILALLNKRKFINDGIVEEKKIIESTDRLNQGRPLVEGLQKNIEKLKIFKKLSNDRFLLKNNIAQQNEILGSTNFVSKAKIIFGNTKDNFAIYEELKEKINNVRLKLKEKDELEKFIKGCNLILNYTRENNSSKVIIEDIKKLNEKVDEILSVSISKKKINNQILECNKKIESYSKEIEKDIIIYRNKLEQVGKCPICNGTIDKVIINQIIKEKINYERKQ